MFSIDLVHQGTLHTVPAGGCFAAPREAGFRDTPAAELRELIGEVEAGRAWREALAARYEGSKNWLYRIVADPSRTAFFGPVLPEGGGVVLDIGSGWGQIARPLATKRPVVALEPVAERLAFVRAAARQEGIHDRMAFVESDYFEVEFTTRFSVICAIGVLEWAGAFQGTADAQERQRAFLGKTRNELAAGGSLILGIENRLGLKYLLGCPDDHIGVPHIACLPADLARRRWQEAGGHRLQSFTYSSTELEAMLRAAGFTTVEFFAAFPDYKLPQRILSLADGGRALNRQLREGPFPPDHNGYDGSRLDPGLLDVLGAHYQSLAAEGIAHHFVPSFFVRAG